MNRGQLITRVQAKTGVSTDDAAELQLLQDWAQDAVIEVLLETHCYIQIGDVTLTSGTSEYRIDANILAIDNGRGSTPAGIGLYEIVDIDSMIEYQSLNPVTQGWKKKIAFSNDLMIVVPTPAAGETLRFFHVPRPTNMSSDSHDPANVTYGGINTEYHRALEYYMVWQATEYNDKGGGFYRGRAFAAGSTMHDQFRDECKLIRKRIRHKAHRGLAPARIGYPGSRGTGRRNDTYPER